MRTLYAPLGGIFQSWRGHERRLQCSSGRERGSTRGQTIEITELTAGWTETDWTSHFPPGLRELIPDTVRGIEQHVVLRHQGPYSGNKEIGDWEARRPGFASFPLHLSTCGSQVGKGLAVGADPPCRGMTPVPVAGEPTSKKVGKIPGVAGCGASTVVAREGCSGIRKDQECSTH